MKKLLLNCSAIGALGVLLFLTSCSDDERPLPDSLSSFEVTTVAPEVHLPVYFENSSLNAAYYVWDFGDGAIDSAKSVSINHTYDEPGDYTVKLRAYNEDGVFQESERTVDIGQRYLTSAAILNIGMRDSDGNLWDEDGSGPDVLWQIGPLDATTIEEIVGVFIEDLNKGGEGDFATPIGISTDDFIPADFLLSNEDFFIQLEDVDTVDTVPDYIPMVGITFNPVVQADDDIATSFKYDDGTGFIQIPFVVIEQYQFILNFEIR